MQMIATQAPGKIKNLVKYMSIIHPHSQYFMTSLFFASKVFFCSRCLLEWLESL